jgi:hypothetical protein
MHKYRMLCTITCSDVVRMAAAMTFLRILCTTLHMRADHAAGRGDARAKSPTSTCTYWMKVAWLLLLSILLFGGTTVSAMQPGEEH